jgi:3',5'-cyclic AMP phosphodiesterase CpdA
MRLCHISDLHFQADIPLSRFPTLGWRRLAAQAEYRLLGRKERFRDVPGTVRRLLAEATRWGADHLLVSGDLTAIALPEEFEAAREALSGWSGRMTILPGNHDRYTPDAARQQLFERAFEKELRSDLPESAVDGAYPLVKLVGADTALVGLTSARVPLIPGFAAGWIGAAQRRRLSEILQSAELRHRAIFVACHHAPFRSTGEPDRLNHGLLDAAQLLASLRDHRVVGLGHGHIHRRYRIDKPGGPPIFCAGSSTERGKQGFFRYEIQGQAVTAEAISIQMDPG